MATWDDVRRIVGALPEVEEVRAHQWRVRKKLVVTERPLRKADFEALGEAAPPDPILAVPVPDEFAKKALIASDPDIYFTTPHFDGYPMVLIELENIEVDELEELIVDSWLIRAPKRLARSYLDSRPSVSEGQPPT
jgi:hypothetical protein